MSKHIDTLISDVYSLLLDSSAKKVIREHSDRLSQEIQLCMQEYIEGDESRKDKPFLRLSKIGTPDRKLWYQYKYKDQEPTPEQMDPDREGPKFMRFLIGTLDEALLLFLAREAGHVVEHEQLEVDIDGVLGHIDSVIDGHLVDVKTASHFGSMKFEDLKSSDPYGYIAQLSAYKQGLLDMGVELKEPSYFWVYNKSNSNMNLYEVTEADMINATERVSRCKDVLEMPSPPRKKCYDPVPYGKSGNMILNKLCTWCPFKEECWHGANKGEGLRAFQYAKGPVYFTHIEEEPTVPEVT